MSCKKTQNRCFWGLFSTAARLHKRLGQQQAATDVNGEPAAMMPSEPIDVSSEPPMSAVDASLAWLRSRPGSWGARAAERLGPANDFLFDLELYDSCDIDDEGAGHLAVALASNSSLTYLNLFSRQAPR